MGDGVTATPPALSYELAAGISRRHAGRAATVGALARIQDPEGFWQAIKPFLQLAG
jgi:hypothetical protein